MLRIIRHDHQSYPASMQEQEAQVSYILENRETSCLILTEHPPLYTIGTSGNASDILQRQIGGTHIDTYSTGRGGEVTYHGPGQLLCYVVADLRGAQDLHQHVWRLEEMIILTLDTLGISAGRDQRGIGVWVESNKIAAVGVRCRSWVAWHGVALNIAPDMAHFKGIVPCGMRDAPVTSLQQLGVDVSRWQVEQALLPHAHHLFDTI